MMGVYNHHTAQEETGSVFRRWTDFALAEGNPKSSTQVIQFEDNSAKL